MMMTTRSSKISQKALLDVLVGRYGETDLRILCADLEVEYDHVKRETKPDTVISLLEFLNRRERLNEVIASGRIRRPDIEWDSVYESQAAEKSSVPSELPIAQPVVNTDAPAQPTSEASNDVNRERFRHWANVTKWLQQNWRVLMLALVLGAVAGCALWVPLHGLTKSWTCKQIRIVPDPRQVKLAAPADSGSSTGVAYTLTAPPCVGVRILFHTAHHLINNNGVEKITVEGKHFWHAGIHVAARDSVTIKDGIYLDGLDVKAARTYQTAQLIQRLTFHMLTDAGDYCERAAEDVQIEMTGLSLTPDAPAPTPSKTAAPMPTASSHFTSTGAMDYLLVSSTFQEDAEGWTIEGAGNGPIWESGGGNPGGFINGDDSFIETTDWFWVAPAKFTGDLSAAYGGMLFFDLIQNVRNKQITTTGDVILQGAMARLFYDIDNPGREWRSYAIWLHEFGDWKNSEGRAATQGEMRSVLASLRKIMIRGDFSDGGERIGLDNVVLVRRLRSGD